jgi:hypothetical protein
MFCMRGLLTCEIDIRAWHMSERMYLCMNERNVSLPFLYTFHFYQEYPSIGSARWIRT